MTALIDDIKWFYFVCLRNKHLKQKRLFWLSFICTPAAGCWLLAAGGIFRTLFAYHDDPVHSVHLLLLFLLFLLIFHCSCDILSGLLCRCLGRNYAGPRPQPKAARPLWNGPGKTIAKLCKVILKRIYFWIVVNLIYCLFFLFNSTTK